MRRTTVHDERYNRLQIANAVNEVKRHCRLINVRWKAPAVPYPGRLAGWKPTREFFSPQGIRPFPHHDAAYLNPFSSWMS